jgi:hypothetical protein
MIKTIITHSGLAHTDDFLSCCILSYKFNPKIIKRVNVVEEKDFYNFQNIIIDIGGKYDGQIHFDHHQDPNLNCSLVLILKDLFNYDLDLLLKIDEIKMIDLQDRYGIKKAQELMNINNPIINLTEYSILRWFSEKKEIIENELFKCEIDVLKGIGKEFLNYIDGFKKEEEKILQSKIYKTPNGVIVYNPTITFNITILTKLISNLIGVIHQSDRDNNLVNIVQINNSPYFQPTKILTFLNPVFVHKTGFLIVVKKEDLNQINLINLIFENK